MNDQNFKYTVIVNPNHDSYPRNKDLTSKKIEPFENEILENDKAIEINCNNCLAFLRKGSNFASLNKYNDAIKQFDHIINMNDDLLLEAHFGKGCALNELGDYKQAILEFDEVLKINEVYADAYHNKGKALFKLNRYDDAIIEYDKAISLDSSDSLYFNHKGLALMSLNKADAAIVEFDNAIQLNPNESIHFNNKGIALVMKGEFEKAILLLEKAESAFIELDSDSEFHESKGSILTKMKQYEKAIIEYDKAIDLSNGKNDAAYFGKSDLLKQMKIYNEAIENIDTAILLAPDEYFYYYAKAVIFVDLKQYDRAIIELEKSLNIEQDFCEAIKIKAFSLLELSKYREAVDEYSKAILLEPYEADTYYGKSIALSSDFRYQEALEALNEALKHNPNHEPSLEFKKGVLARLLVDQKGIEDADAVTVLLSTLLSNNSKKYDIFKSYAHKDKDLVDPFISLLKHQYGLKIWIDTEDIEFGEDWRTEVVDGVRESKLVLCFITKNYLASKISRKELKIAKNTNQKIFLLMLEDVDIDSDSDLTYFINGLQRVLLFKNSVYSGIWTGEIFHKLLISISQVTQIALSIATIVEPYEINVKDWSSMKKAELDSGQSAVVYKASYKNKEVAVKRFYSLYPSGGYNELVFKNEMEILGQMKHENIVQFIGYYNTSDTYLVLEYMHTSLYKKLYSNNCEVLDWAKKLEIMKDVLRGLNYLHESQNLIHGDIKSQNILIKKEDDRLVAKLSDFGLSRIKNTKSSDYQKDNGNNIKIGSIRWTAPERYNGFDTRKSDIWSFGLVLREISIEKLPFDTLNHEMIEFFLVNNRAQIPLNIENVPNEIAELIKCCVERNLKKRISIKQLLETFSYLNIDVVA